MIQLAELRERLRAVRMPPLVGWQRAAAWAGLGVFLFALFLALTFPYDAVRARISSEADSAGLWVRIDSMEPTWATSRRSALYMSFRLPLPARPIGSRRRRIAVTVAG